jgi:hypothetical protein
MNSPSNQRRQMCRWSKRRLLAQSVPDRVILVAMKPQRMIQAE